jgi:hypothetical protein
MSLQRIGLEIGTVGPLITALCHVWSQRIFFAITIFKEPLLLKNSLVEFCISTSMKFNRKELRCKICSASGLFAPVDTHVFAPVDILVFAPVDTRVFAPADTYVFVPVDTCVFAPVDTCVFAPADTHVCALVDTHVFALVVTHVFAPVDRYVFAPVDTYVFAPVDKMYFHPQIYAYFTYRHKSQTVPNTNIIFCNLF